MLHWDEASWPMPRFAIYRRLTSHRMIDSRPTFLYKQVAYPNFKPRPKLARKGCDKCLLEESMTKKMEPKIVFCFVDNNVQL